VLRTLGLGLRLELQLNLRFLCALRDDAALLHETRFDRGDSHVLSLLD
jgi:hypothetical protein